MISKKMFYYFGGIFFVFISACFVVYFLSFGKIEVSSDPNGAIIKYNGKERKAPFIVRLKKGNYDITANLENYPPQTKNVKVESRKTAKVDFNLKVGEPVENVNVGFGFDDPIFKRTSDYSIDPPSDPNKYDITIRVFAIFNAGVNGPPIEEQEKTYNEQLKQYKSEALDWIKQQEIDPNDLKIEWVPADAAKI